MGFANFMQYIVYNYETYSEPSQVSKIELFSEIVNYFQPLTILAKSSILMFNWELGIRLCIYN